jgi:hypothetical protein
MEKDYMDNTVDAVHPKHDEWKEISRLPRALMAGTRGMVSQGEKFLPKFKFESQEHYNARLTRTILNNAYRKTVQFLSGQVFQSSIDITDEFPDQVKQYFKDVDLLGSPLGVFCKRLFERGLAGGVSHILVDAPVKNEGVRTRADQFNQGVRPYFKDLDPLSVIAWRTDAAGRLTQIRYTESITEPDGEFGLKTSTRIKVLEPGRWLEYGQAGDSNNFDLIDSGETGLDTIPIVSFIPGEPLSAMTGETPLSDLAYLNLHHWQSFSDQKNALHVARVPMLFAKMIDLKNLTVATSSAILSDNEDADLKYVEHTGAAIAAGQKDLEECEASMALYGLQQMIDRTGGVTATEKALATAESNSSLGMWVLEFQDTLFAALKLFGEYMDVEVPDESVAMPTAFQKGILDPTLMKTILDYVAAGIISKRAAFEAINRMEILGEGLTWDMIQDDMTVEAQQAPVNDLAGLFG